MQKLKDTLSGTFGAVGFILYYLILLGLSFIPFRYLFPNLPLFVPALFVFVIYEIPLIGGIVQLIIWIWSFVIVVTNPIDAWSIAYFCFFTIYAITILSRVISSLINK